ncbi:hypothetical protein SASPL_114304 [Salvia splendens]|uniref:Uncharacterized protein n=1 Tax=Salvia splendens TaxID=180675 RepID=A0A8X9A096_SALSN|nr:hypothetical protein SASPL_114304 [Salvia splendens]
MEFKLPKQVHVVHEWAWAGSPNEGVAWLRLQRLADTWHRILLIPVLGGVIVGVLHGLLEILAQIKQSTSSQGQGLDVLAAIFPILKAGVTLGTGCSLGFNAAGAGCFFAIETVLRPLRAENPPPFTTAMIILASVVSSTVSNAVLGEKQAFTSDVD